MRRFELSDGTSNKFWEVDVEGSTLTTRWGRIGTAGQTKSKSFASDDKAKGERDSLVKEKVGKGYSEVAAAGTKLTPVAVAAPASPPPPKAAAATATTAAPASPAQPAAAAVPSSPSSPSPAVAAAPIVVPAVAVAAADAPPTVHWTDALRRRCYPRRSTNGKPPRLDAVAAHAAVYAHFGTISGAWEDSSSHNDAALAPLVTAAAARLATKSPAGPASAEVEGAALIMLQHRMAYDHEPPVDELVEWWTATAGAPFAIAALRASLDVATNESFGTQVSLVPATTSHSHGSRFGRGQIQGWLWLRSHLATVDEPAWQAARHVAERLRADAATAPTFPARLALDFLFPDVPEWAATDVETMLASGSFSYAAGAVLSCLREGALMLRLIKAAPWPHSLAPSDGPYRRNLLELLVSMVDSAGPSAAPALVAFFDVQGGSEWRRDCAQALALIDSDEVVALMVERLDDKDMLAAASQSLTRTPRRALPALAAQTGRGRTGQMAEQVLSMIVKQHPAIVDELLPTLPAAARATVEAIRTRTAIPDREATVAELPPVLAAPPWLRPKKASTDKPLELAVPPLADELRWRPGQRNQWIDLGPRYPQQADRILERIGLAAIPRDPATPPAELRQFVVQANANRYVGPSELCYLPEPLALAIWDALPPHCWSLTYEHLEPLLARYELKALPGLVRLAEALPVHAVDVALPFASTRLAPAMAHAFVHLKKARAGAQRWLLAHPEHAIAGLIPPAVGAASKARDAAGSAVRLLAAHGHAAAIAQAAARYNPATVEAVTAVLEFDPLDLYPARLPKLPPFAQPGSQAGALTRPLLSGRAAALPLAVVDHLLMMLAFSRADEPYAGLVQVKERCDPASLAQFAWDLFSAWLLAGAPAKEAWAFHALGVFGDDPAARKLATLVREWPGESAHARAVLGLDVLAAIGSDVALMHLNGIAQKVKFKGLQDKAREKIAAVAEARGFTTDELADRLVPDLGLDERGSLRLDFGARSFSVGFDEHLRPLVRDEAGKPLPDLPKPGKNDDAEKAPAAQAIWKTLKKDAKMLAAQQILRLELGMCARRRWTGAVFRMFLVEHPLLQHLVRRVLWGVYQGAGALTATFRVSEDGSYADASDDPFTLADDADVGVAHSLELPADLAARWGQLFGDYEILQPFRQLGREVYTIADAEKATKTLDRLKGVTVATGKLLGLEARGWRRGQAQDGGLIHWFEKALPDGREAHLEFAPGIIVGMVTDNPEQTLEELGLLKAGTYSWHDKGNVPFGELDPIVFSELVRDLEALRS